MSGNITLTEVSEALAIVWKTYELGWVQDQPSAQHFAEFGADIRALAQNLRNVIRIVENARLVYQQHAIRSPMFQGFYAQRDWDLSSLHEIAGRFKTTITECEELLSQNREVYRNQASMYNEEWTLVFQPKVADLQARVRTHNSKLSILLRPLEAKLLAEIRHEFGGQSTHDELGQGLRTPPLSGMLVPDIDKTIAEYEQQQPILLDVPPEVEGNVRRTVAEQLRPEIKFPGTMPLQAGVDSFFHCFEQSTKSFSAGDFVNERTPSPTQYINLITSLIILRQIQESQELRRVAEHSLWPMYIAELTVVLRSECQRFTGPSSKYLIAPDSLSLERELARRGDGDGSKDQVKHLMSPHFKTYTEEILKVPLPSPQDALQRQLVISRVDAHKLRLVESISSKAAPSNSLGEITLDIDLKTVQLTPIYATPSSRPRPLELLLHTGTSQLNPNFLEPKHIYRLQHLLTGYKVYDRYDQAMVKVTFTIAGQSVPLEEHGRVQLWLPQPYSSANKSVNPTETSSQSNIALSRQVSSSQSLAPSPVTPATPAKRAASIRRWIPGLRRNSSTENTIPNDTRSSRNHSTATLTQATLTQATSHTTTPTAQPWMANSRTVPEITRSNYASTGMPEQYGPFELSAGVTAPSLPPANSSGLHSRSSSFNLAPHTNSSSPQLPYRSSPNRVGAAEQGHGQEYSPHQNPPPPTFESRNNAVFNGGGPMDPIWPRITPSPAPSSPDLYHPAASHHMNPNHYNAVAGNSRSPDPHIPATNSRSPDMYNQAASHYSRPDHYNPAAANSRSPDPYSQAATYHMNPTHSMSPTYPMSPSYPMNPNYAMNTSNTTSPTYPMSPTDSTHALNPTTTSAYASSSVYASSTTNTNNHGYNLPSKLARGSPSVMSSQTTRSTRSQSSLAPTVSTIKTSTGPSSSGVARMHHKPQKPLLVIFLKSKDTSAKLSIVAIQLDTHTSVKRERCDCYNSHSTCRISCLEREKGGSLLAQRWEADAGLNSWNLAKVGESQRKEGEGIWPNLRRVSMKFEKMEDRYKFAGSPCSCNVKTTHELSRCNLNSHNGLFGIVKQIGEQMLLNYHNERNSAMAKTMVLSPLSEDEV